MKAQRAGSRGPQCNRLHPRGIGFAFHGVNIPPQLNTRRVPGSTGRAGQALHGVNMAQRAEQVKEAAESSQLKADRLKA